MSPAPILLLTGPPGSGKSPVAPLIADRFDLAVCMESGWFWTTIVRGHVHPWLPEADEQNGAVLRAVVAAAAELADRGYMVVMSGIFGPWHLDLVTDVLRKRVDDLHYVVLRPGFDVTFGRAQTRLPLTPGSLRFPTKVPSGNCGSNSRTSDHSGAMSSTTEPRVPRRRRATSGRGL